MNQNYKKAITSVLASLSIFIALVFVLSTVQKLVLRAEESSSITIQSMSYFSDKDGPTIVKSGVEEASFGFVMPIFNGGQNNWTEVHEDLGVEINVDNNWVDINSVPQFTYNVNWGHWQEETVNGFWFRISESLELRLISLNNPTITLPYTLLFENIPKTFVQRMDYRQGPNLTADTTGGSGFTFPIFNSNPDLIFEAVAHDIALYVKGEGESDWINIDNNPESGWIYDENFGNFAEGGGGYWFHVTESTDVKLQAKSSNVELIYHISYERPVRTNWLLTPNGSLSFQADMNGAIGVPLPYIGGSLPVRSDLDGYIYEIEIDGVWYNLSDTALSGFTYQSRGYNQFSDANQWGYWADYVFGLWFQPVQEDMRIRIGYPADGVVGSAINGNYVVYQFIGNPDAPRPDPSTQENIQIGTPDDSELANYNLIWNDEFLGSSLDTTKWSYDLGYYHTEGDPNSWGWGNAELEYYTNHIDNVFVSDGNVNIRAISQPKTFPLTPEHEALYSSGRIKTKDNFSFTYGRVDIRAKLPQGTGLWPALWMLPEHSTYGPWAASGEIDIMEAKGRLPGQISAALHYGGSWPANIYSSGEYYFSEGQSIGDYNVYTMIWEEDSIRWYVNGEFFYQMASSQWYSTASSNNGAPFDTPFHIIMNLAVGGYFDGLRTPSAGDIPATMSVDYVRVYKSRIGNGSEPTVTPTTGELTTTTDTSSTTSAVPEETTTTIATQPEITTTIVNGDEKTGFIKKGNSLEFYVHSAIFADLHYKINSGELINVAMQELSPKNFTYTISGLNGGDIIKYFFTYNPGNGAIDTELQSYVLDGSPSTQTTTLPTTTVAVTTTTQSTSTPTEPPIDNHGVSRLVNGLRFNVRDAVFADLHYRINGRELINVSMISTGGGDFYYEVVNLLPGDLVEYFFTYDPGNGALDTAAESLVF